jgi:hypothetical protein
VFDSASVTAKAYAPSDAACPRYLEQFRQVERLAAQEKRSSFLSHHPVLGLGLAKNGKPIKPANEGLQSVMKSLQPERLFPLGVDVAMHGHVHLFEAIGFASDHPATFVLGNSGSAAEGGLPDTLPAGTSPAMGARIAEFATRPGFGFASLEPGRTPQRATRGRRLGRHSNEAGGQAQGGRTGEARGDEDQGGRGAACSGQSGR